LLGFVFACSLITVGAQEQMNDQSVTEQVQQEFEVPEMLDIFGGMGNDDLMNRVLAVEDKRDDLTCFEKTQLAIAFLKACTMQEIRDLIVEHFKANSKRYMVGATVASVFVATDLLLRILESSPKAKTSKPA